MIGYLDEFRKNLLPGLLCEQKDDTFKFSGNCYSTLTDLLSAEYYTTCSGYIYGYISGLASKNDEQVICTGNVKGNIINTKNIQEIKVSGTLTGIINLVEDITNNTYDNKQYFELTNVSGNLVNTNYGQSPKLEHIIDLQQTHIIGREILADTNPLFGEKLNVIPSAINRQLLLQPVQWDIVEYQICVSEPLDNKNKIPKIIRPERPEYDSSQNLFTLRLATPEYINSVSRTYSNVSEKNHISSTSGIMVDEYYAIIFDNEIEILMNIDFSKYEQKEIINFIGPTKSYDQLINILNLYANINNVTLKQISEFQFELV